MDVLDIDRARNVGVLMRSLKMDVRGIEAALQATLFNDGSGQRSLEEFEIEGILAAFPTPEEERKLKCLGYMSTYCACRLKGDSVSSFLLPPLFVFENRAIPLWFIVVALEES